MSNTRNTSKEVKNVCFRAPKELVDFLDMLADYMGLDRSEVIRTILYNVMVNFMMNRFMFLPGLKPRSESEGK